MTATPAGDGDASSRRDATRAERIVAWLMRLAQSLGAVPATALYNLAQSVALPGPSDTLFLPLAIAEPRRALRLAVTVLVAATIGSSAAWAIGAGALDVAAAGGVGRLLGLDADWLAGARRTMADKGWLFILISPLTPISTKLMAYGAGAVGMSWSWFMLPLTIGRLVRYAVLVPLIRRGLGDELLKYLGIDRATLDALTAPTRAPAPPGAGAHPRPD